MDTSPPPIEYPCVPNCQALSDRQSNDFTATVEDPCARQCASAAPFRGSTTETWPEGRAQAIQCAPLVPPIEIDPDVASQALASNVCDCVWVSLLGNRKVATSDSGTRKSRQSRVPAIVEAQNTVSKPNACPGLFSIAKIGRWSTPIGTVRIGLFFTTSHSRIPPSRRTHCEPRLMSRIELTKRLFVIFASSFGTPDMDHTLTTLERDAVARMRSF
mmetsp:Transcript_13126/g.23300  ORF Transcript_13126/g.23300 Transcript_13126/m.23300 type:complete len:216 (-) Transcript_13126:1708-2355(-)